MSKLLIGTYQVTIENGVLSSNLERKATDHGQWDEYTAAMDGFEATILALHQAGIALAAEPVYSALVTAVNAIENSYGE